jgi:hypothetical protein
MPLADRRAGRDGVSARPPDGFDPALLSEEEEAPPPRMTHTRDCEPPEYDYNCISYWFDAARIGARFYLDSPREVSVEEPRETLALPEMRCVLVYLQRRFEVIRCREANFGYVEAWRVTD